LINLLIVDDDPFIRESLKLILDLDPYISVMGACANGEEAFQFVQLNPIVNVVIMDIRMPLCNGVEGTKKIKHIAPQVAILILTTFDDDEYIVQALKNGANGYLLKNIPPDRIIEGIKTVHHGDLLIHPRIAKKLTGLLQPLSPLPVKPPKSLLQYGLTPTEQLVVLQIAREMFLSEGTVKNYITEILSKLSLRDRTQIAIFYLKNEG
jgi:DNA-binding NarL/FixJ family response regulator